MGPFMVVGVVGLIGLGVECGGRGGLSVWMLARVVDGCRDLDLTGVWAGDVYY
jgi:hypothetical protein